MVVAGAWGWPALTEPLPGRRARPALRRTPPSPPGPRCFRDQVVVSVFNGSTRARLAGATIEQLERARLRRRATSATPRSPGRAPRSGRPTRQNPAVGWSSGSSRRPRSSAPRSTGSRSARASSSWSGEKLHVAAQEGGRVREGRGRRDVLQPAGLLSPVSPRSAPASRLAGPLREPAAVRDLAQPLLGGHRAALRGVTTSRSSPWRRTVRRSGTSTSPCRMTSETEAPCGSRSSPTSTPCMLRDRADRRPAAGRPRPARAARPRRRGPAARSAGRPAAAARPTAGSGR